MGAQSLSTSPVKIQAPCRAKQAVIVFNVCRITSAVDVSTPPPSPFPYWPWLNAPQITPRRGVLTAISYWNGTRDLGPGDNIEMTVKLIAPVAMDEQLRFAVREGGRTVGSGVIIKVTK